MPACLDSAHDTRSPRNLISRRRESCNFFKSSLSFYRVKMEEGSWTRNREGNLKKKKWKKMIKGRLATQRSKEFQTRERTETVRKCRGWCGVTETKGKCGLERGKKERQLVKGYGIWG